MQSYIQQSLYFVVPVVGLVGPLYLYEISFGTLLFYSLLYVFALIGIVLTVTLMIAGLYTYIAKDMLDENREMKTKIRDMQDKVIDLEKKPIPSHIPENEMYSQMPPPMPPMGVSRNLIPRYRWPVEAEAAVEEPEAAVKEPEAAAEAAVEEPEAAVDPI